MTSDIPPMNIEYPTADAYRPFQYFNTKEEANAYIQINGGMIIKDGEKDRFIVIRIPKEKK